MEFFKNNWVKIIVASMTLAGVVLFITLLAMYDASYHNNLTSPLLPEDIADPRNARSILFGYIAGLTFFALVTVVLIVSMFKTTRNYKIFMLCGVGLICTILLVISITGAIGSQQSRFARSVMSGDHNATITTRVQGVVRAQILDAFPLYVVIQNVAVEDWVATLVGAAMAELIPLSPTEAEMTGQALVNNFNNAVAENAPVQIREAQNSARYQFFSRLVSLVSKLLVFGLLPFAWAIHHPHAKTLFNFRI